MKKNVAGQFIGVEMITAANGSAFTGAVSVFVEIDNGTQTAGAATAPVHKGNGSHSYAPTQAETNGDHIAYVWTGTGAIPQKTQVYTTFPQVEALSAVAIENLNQSALAIIPGAATGTPTTTSMNTDITGYLDNELVGRAVLFNGGVADGQPATILTYTATGGIITFAALTTAPVAADTFVIV